MHTRISKATTGMLCHHQDECHEHLKLSYIKIMLKGLQ